MQEPKPVIDDKPRIPVVEAQRLIEVSLTTGSAIFVVKDMLTPLFISHEHVYLDEKDNLFKMKNDEKTFIPAGLIPEEKLNDPKQLSTVLGRVLSMRAMLESGVEITVIHMNRDRPKVGNNNEFVDSTNIVKLKEQYKNLHFCIIPQETYDDYQTKVCTATYCDEQSGVKVFKGIEANKIHSITNQHEWGVKDDNQVAGKISSLNELLEDCGMTPITSSPDYII